MLSRERKAELVSLADKIAHDLANELAVMQLAAILAELTEAMPEEGCGEAGIKYRCFHCQQIVRRGEEHRHPPKPISSDEMADKIAAAMQKARDQIGATEQQRIAFAYAEAAMRSVLAASPTGVGEEGTAG